MSGPLLTKAEIADIRDHFEGPDHERGRCEHEDAVLELIQHVEALETEIAAARDRNRALHRRAQKAEGALLKAQRQPVDTWSSLERQQEADERDRMMAAVGKAATR